MKNFLANFEEIIASVFLAVLLTVTIGNVFARYTTSRSFSWAEEISYMCFGWVVFVGAGAAYKRFMHPSVDLIVNMLPKKIAKGMTFLIAFCLLFICAAVVVLSASFALNAWTKRTSTLFIPYTFIDMSVTIGFLFMTIHSVSILRKIFKLENYKEEKLYAHVSDIDVEDCE